MLANAGFLSPFAQGAFSGRTCQAEQSPPNLHHPSRSMSRWSRESYDIDMTVLVPLRFNLQLPPVAFRLERRRKLGDFIEKREPPWPLPACPGWSRCHGEGAGS